MQIVLCSAMFSLDRFAISIPENHASLEYGISVLRVFIVGDCWWVLSGPTRPTLSSAHLRPCWLVLTNVGVIFGGGGGM